MVNLHQFSGETSFALGGAVCSLRGIEVETQ